MISVLLTAFVILTVQAKVIKIEPLTGDSVTEVAITTDDVLQFAYTENPTTGFVHFISKDAALQFGTISSRFKRPTELRPRVGAAGERIFTYEPTSAGHETLTVFFGRPWLPPDTYTKAGVIDISISTPSDRDASP